MMPDNLAERYGDVDLAFSSYYKFSFAFHGTAPDGNRITGRYGGSADDIYRFEVTNDGVVKAREMSSGTIKAPDGTIVGEWNDW